MCYAFMFIFYQLMFNALTSRACVGLIFLLILIHQPSGLLLTTLADPSISTVIGDQY